MFDRLSSEARKVMDRAYREARRLQHDYFGSEHVLVSLLSDDSGLIAKSLARIGRNAPGFYTHVSEVLEEGERPLDCLQLPLTPGVKRCLAFGPSHLLLGLFRDESGQARQLLEELGLGPE